jgi:NDP-sugar pyrophosphorylase family protein
VVLCTGKFSDQIKHYVGDGSLWGLNLKYSEDGDTPLGTGGAIKKALPMLGYYFMVLNGDTFFPIDLARTHHYFCLSHKLARMYKYHNVDCGFYIFTKTLFEKYPDDSFALWDLMEVLIEKHQMETVVTETKFYDMGTPAGLKETEEYLWSLVQT